MAGERLPTTMRALMFSQPAQSLELIDAHPVPQPNLDEDEHLVKIHSTAITIGELLWQFPVDAYADYSPGVEASGTIVISPPGSRFPVGSKVYFRTSSPRCGSAREYTIALGRELAFQPQNITPEQSASIPVSALTAWQALFEQAGFQPNFDKSQAQLPIEQRRKILIVGASGSVGVWATQIAALAGFWIAGTCHSRNTVMVKHLGAHEVIDYTQTSIRQWLEDSNMAGKFDLVFDCYTPGGSTEAWHAANSDNGLFLSIVGATDGAYKWNLDRPEGIAAGVTGRFFIMTSNGEQLQNITQLIEAGRANPVVDSVFEIAEFKKAFERADSGKATGKVVLHI